MADMIKPPNIDTPPFSGLYGIKTHHIDNKKDLSDSFEETFKNLDANKTFKQAKHYVDKTQKIQKRHASGSCHHQVDHSKIKQSILKSNESESKSRSFNETSDKTKNSLNEIDLSNHKAIADSNILAIEQHPLYAMHMNGIVAENIDDLEIMTDLLLEEDIQDNFDEDTYQDIDEILSLQSVQNNQIIEQYNRKETENDQTKIKPIDDHSGGVLSINYFEDGYQIHEPDVSLQSTDQNIILNKGEQELLDRFVQSSGKEVEPQQNVLAELTSSQRHDADHSVSEHVETDIKSAVKPNSLLGGTNSDKAIPESQTLIFEMADNIKNDQSKPISVKMTTGQNLAELKRSTIVPLQFDPQQKNDDMSLAPLKDNTTVVSPSVEVSSVGGENTENSMNFSQFSGMSSPFKGMVEQGKQITHHLISSNPAVEFIETLRQHFKNFGKNQTPRLTIQMRHGGKNLTIHFLADHHDHIHITFRTKERQWEQILNENKGMIASLFENESHTVSIKYLGEEE